jgi:hypothetical protein
LKSRAAATKTKVCGTKRRGGYSSNADGGIQPQIGSRVHTDIGTLIKIHWLAHALLTASKRPWRQSWCCQW